MATDLILICHGQALQREGNHLFGWWANMPLSPRGKQQAILIGERLKSDFDICTIYTSPQKRAHETAHIVSQCVKGTPVVDHALRELDSGELATLTYEEARTRYPEVVEGHEIDRIPGGESYADMHRRVTHTINRLIRQNPDGQIACITHGGPIVAYLRAFMGYAPEQANKPHFLCNIASMHHIQVDSDSYSMVVSLNDIAHLAGLPV